MGVDGWLGDVCVAGGGVGDCSDEEGCCSQQKKGQREVQWNGLTLILPQELGLAALPTSFTCAFTFLRR